MNVEGIKNKLKGLFSALGILFVLLFLCVLFAVKAPGFVSVRNLYYVLQQVSVVGILTIGQTYVIISKGIDLSQGAIIGFSSIMSAILIVNKGLPVWCAFVIIILAGALIGFINGILIAKLNVPAMIATLGTTNIVSAIALLSCNGSNIYSLPASIKAFASIKLWGFMPGITCIMFVMFIVAYIALMKTKFGRYTYAIGSNELSARFSGIRVTRHLISVYTISGIVSAVAGVIMVCRLNSGVATAGDGYEMNSIAAVFIGGGSLFGGEGSIIGSLVGALIMSVLSNGLQLMGISTYWQKLFVGVVLIGAVVIDNLRRKKMS